LFRSLHRRVIVSMLLLTCLYSLTTVCRAEDHEMLCSYGFGSFSSKFNTGITLSVEPVRKQEFSARVCSASLDWKGGKLSVTPTASEVDLDVLGADFGLGSPVAALQIRENGADKLVKYEIYSLQKPVQKLYTLTGGDYFSAADTDLDGRVEIWTDDAGAIDGFENLSLSTFDAAPTMVLRFEQHHLLDVSAEFQPEYDKQIATLKASLDASVLSQFKNSDGKLSDRSSLPLDQAHALMNTKIKVLEIAWAYLYSGREQEAWDTLASMWPAADLERIQSAIRKAHAGGMQSKVDGVSPHPSGLHVRRHAAIFDAELQYKKDDHMKQFQADVIPQAILLRRPPLPVTAQASLNAEIVLNLVIDAAGKVRSAKPDGPSDKALIASTVDWKFIPAFKNGRAVASSMRYGVTPNR